MTFNQYSVFNFHFYTYWQLLLLAVVRLAKARVADSLTLPFSELTILISGPSPSVKL